MVRSRSKKGDPLTEHARALTAEIAALESQIRELGARLESPAEAVDEGDSRGGNGGRARRGAGRGTSESEMGTQARVPSGKGAGEAEQRRYNELGARKFDLPDAWRRLRQKPEGPSPDHARLINYLAAGSIQGLRPLRYEKRVARNRMLALSLLLLFVLWGFVAVFVRG